MENENYDISKDSKVPKLSKMIYEQNILNKVHFNYSEECLVGYGVCLRYKILLRQIVNLTRILFYHMKIYKFLINLINCTTEKNLQSYYAFI